LGHCLSLHKDTTPHQPNHTVTPTHIEPEQYTNTQSQDPEDECTSIRNMLKKKASDISWSIFIQEIHCPFNTKGIIPFSGRVSVSLLYLEYDCLLSCCEPDKTILQVYLNLLLHLLLPTPQTLIFLIFQDDVTFRSIRSRS
jgi:hypothetical protein